MFHYWISWGLPTWRLGGNLSKFTLNPKIPRRYKISQGESIYSIGCARNRDARPAPPRPAPGKNGCPGPPRPRKISTLPSPALPRKKIVLPRPENIDRMFRGKVRGKCSYITKRFCESKTFEQYFLAPKVLLVAPKVLLEDIQIPPIHF